MPLLLGSSECGKKVMKDGGYTFGDFTKYGGLIQAHRIASHVRRWNGFTLLGVLYAVFPPVRVP